jgi:hypothetical protein
MPDIGDLQVAQFFRTTLTQSIVASTNTKEIFVQSVAGFPIPSGAQYFYLTLVDGDTAEIVKIGDVDAGNKKLTTFAGDAVLGGFDWTTSRAELWFTAEAFVDIQDYLATLGAGGEVYPGIDDISIEAATKIRVKALGILTAHIKDFNVTSDKLATNAVSTAKIQTGAVGNNEISAVDGGKITTGLISPARVLNLTFANIHYTDGGTPIDLPDGSIHFTFKA